MGQVGTLSRKLPEAGDDDFDGNVEYLTLTMSGIYRAWITMRVSILSLTAFAVAIEAQELYLTTTGYAARPQCTKQSTPKYHFQPFSYTLNETVR
jgi:hypothetical protein